MKNQKSINKIICNKYSTKPYFILQISSFRQAVLSLKTEEELNKSTKQDETSDKNKKLTDEVNQ